MLNRPTKRTTPKTKRAIPAPGTTRFVVTKSRAGHYSLTLKVVREARIERAPGDFVTWTRWVDAGHKNMISAPPPQWMKDEMMAALTNKDPR
jgi:hypothetical protein